MPTAVDGPTASKFRSWTDDHGGEPQNYHSLVERPPVQVPTNPIASRVEPAPKNSTLHMKILKVTKDQFARICKMRVIVRESNARNMSDVAKKSDVLKTGDNQNSQLNLLTLIKFKQ